MGTQLGIILMVMSGIVDAEEVDNTPSDSSGLSMNTISADYSEMSIIEEIPQDPVKMNDKGENVKLVVHKSPFHRKHKGLSLAYQRPENHKIEEIKAEKKSGLSSRLTDFHKKIVAEHILIKMQENPAYDWWIEIANRPYPQ